jgi:peptidoglycan hydrolase CwlO-like protein
MKTNDSKINSLQSENQELTLKISNLESQVKEKDGKNTSLQTENQSLKHRIGEYEQQLKVKKKSIKSIC